MEKEFCRLNIFHDLCGNNTLLMETDKTNNEQEAPEYPWYEGQGRGMYDDDREETGDETDTYDNIAGVLRY